MKNFILKRKKKITILSIPLFILLLVSFLFLFIIKPNVYLKGEKEIFIKLNEKYTEPGYDIRYYKKGSKIDIDGNINTEKVGTYEIKYKAKRGFFTTTKMRKVNVIDEEKPVITLNGKTELILCPKEEYKEEGYTALDNYDGDITDKVEVTKEKDIIYKVVDSSLNETKVIRKLSIFDNKFPVIKLKGKSNITLTIGSKYYEDGYTVTDNCDKDLQNKVIKEENVDYNKVGVYKITYSVTDTIGNTSLVNRTIKIIKKPVLKNATIYLTFDDGPSKVTPSVLDILKEEGIKATFFVINKNSSYDYMLKRIVDEGHTIALHSYTHNYYKIYTSVGAFFNDINLISDKVYRITGVRSKIIRFPGGSSNLVSSFNPGIMSTLTWEVLNRGYRYYDWNVGSSDTTKISSNKMYKKVINQIGDSGTYIVLMHDDSYNQNTVKALRDIIIWAKNNGYKLSKITEKTPQIHHGTNN